jgi:hypothetical protein
MPISAPLSAAALTRANRFVEPFEAAGIASGDDDKILVALIALPTGEPDLIDEFLSWNHVRDVFVVMRPLGKQLVLDVDAGDPHIDELTHGAHGVQRLAKAGAGIREHRSQDPSEMPLLQFADPQRK